MCKVKSIRWFANESLPSNNNGKVALMVKAKEVKVIQAIFSVIRRYKSPHFKKKKRLKPTPWKISFVPLIRHPQMLAANGGKKFLTEKITTRIISARVCASIPSAAKEPLAVWMMLPWIPFLSLRHSTNGTDWSQPSYPQFSKPPLTQGCPSGMSSTLSSHIAVSIFTLFISSGKIFTGDLPIFLN